MLTEVSAFYNSYGASPGLFEVNVDDLVIHSLSRISSPFTELLFFFSGPIGGSQIASNACHDTNSTDTTAIVIQLCKMGLGIFKGIFTWTFCL